MFILTESGKIINVAFHRSIKIRSKDNEYSIVAYVDKGSGFHDRGHHKDGYDIDIIATFNNKQDAKKCLDDIANYLKCHSVIDKK